MSDFTLAIGNIASVIYKKIYTFISERSVHVPFIDMLDLLSSLQKRSQASTTGCYDRFHSLFNLWSSLLRAHKRETFFFLLFSIVPAAYGSSQASRWIGAAAEAYTTATAMLDQSCICNLWHSLHQCWILTPLKETREAESSQRQYWVFNPLSHDGNSKTETFKPQVPDMSISGDMRLLQNLPGAITSQLLSV